MLQPDWSLLFPHKRESRRVRGDLCTCDGVGRVLTTNKLPLPTVKQNFSSKFSVQLSPKEAKPGRNHSRGPVVQHWVSWSDGVGLSGSNPTSCESVQQSFPDFVHCKVVLALFLCFSEKLKISSSFGTESSLFSFSSTETPGNVLPFYLLFYCGKHLPFSVCSSLCFLSWHNAGP